MTPLEITAITGFYFGMWFGSLIFIRTFHRQDIHMAHFVITALGWTAVFAYFILS